MYKYKDIKQIHLEITSRCNASCPLCPRNIFGGRVNPNLPLTELTLSDVKAIFPPDFIQQLHLMYTCGNYGDPIAARDTLAVFEYFKECNPHIHLGLNTNGSGKDVEWWRRLAQVVDYCRFGIDGLEDTNHIYRRGTRWQKIIESAAAFIQAGGKAEWDFIVFRHNEHQVDEARELSVKLGFSEFNVKKTYRFIDLVTGHKKEQVNVLNKTGQIDCILEIPQNSAYQNRQLVELDEAVAKYPNYATYLEQTEICCKVVRDKSLYVSAEGLVFPCCWTANIYPWHEFFDAAEIWKLIKQLPEEKNSISAKFYPLSEIVNGSFFQHLIPNTWHRSSLAEGKLKVCARVCGKYDLYSGQQKK